MATLLVSLTVSAVVFATFRFWQSEEPLPEVIHRTLGDISLDWRCESGHHFREMGQIGARKCPTCNQTAWPVDTYVCEVHGPFPVSIRLIHDVDGIDRAGEFRLPGRDWIDAAVPLKCPRCARELTRRPRDPLTGLLNARKKRDGG